MQLTCHRHIFMSLILYEVLQISVIQSDIRALPRIDYGAQMCRHFQPALVSKMALKSVGTLVLRNQFSTGLKYQLEFPWNFLSLPKSRLNFPCFSHYDKASLISNNKTNCDCNIFQCENLNDAEHMTWVIINHVAELIELSHEPPVQDFISAIHRNSAASGLFIQAINSRCENVTRVSLTFP